jgi:lysozyme family protein
VSDVFDTQIALSLDLEQGYSNDPNDKGGETNWGVTAVVARAFGYTGSMHDMTRDQALAIYRARYWTQPGFFLVANIDAPIAAHLLDCGINLGTWTAGKFLQRALNALNNGGKSYPDVTVDGAIGAMTLAAMRAFIAVRGEAGRAVLLKMIRAQQAVRYIEIAEGDPSQELYEYGWQLNRA